MAPSAPMFSAFDGFVSRVFAMGARVLAVAALAAGLALMFVFAAAAAVAAGLLVLGAALAIRFAPRKPRAAGSETLTARPTAAGWVVETGARRV